MTWTWPVTPQDVRDFTKSSESVADAGLVGAVAAVNAYVPTIPALARFVLPPEGDPEGTAVFTPPADVVLGAVMLAARWFARRGSVLGAAAGYSDFGTTAIIRWDPDIARLLRIGTAAPGLVFGAPSLPVAEVVVP